MLLALLLTAGFVALRHTQPALYQRIIQEDALLESLQAAFYVIAAALALSTGLTHTAQKRRRLGAWYALLALAFFFVALEEISWGQRLFQVTSPAYFVGNNFHHEINLHNLLIVQAWLHPLYILATGYGAFAWVALRRPARADRLPHLAPPGYLMPYFLTPCIVYVVMTYVAPPDVNHLLHFRDQEPAEFLLALGLLLWMADQYLASRPALSDLRRLPRLARRVARWWRPDDYTRVVVSGAHSDDWMRALGPGAAVWTEIPGVCDVRHATDSRDEVFRQPSRHRTVVLPLMENHIASCPAGFPALKPDETALHTLQNKGAFAAYAQARGLAASCPQTYATPGAAVFPCVLKRLDLNNCDGIRIVESETDYRACIAQEPWRGHAHLLQEYVADAEDRCTHCVCVDGRILWHCTYLYTAPPNGIQRRYGLTLERVPVTAARLAEFEAFLAPLRFSGPCNVDYVVRANGRTAILEINPRLGGSLMRPANRTDLLAALTVILQHAR